MIIPVSQKWEHKEAKWPGKMHQLDDMAWWLRACSVIRGLIITPYTGIAEHKLHSPSVSVSLCVLHSNCELDKAEGQIPMFS